ncbi:TlpA disulfide reductase family protein [Pseudoduganella sp. SL102]|uniref:TlpA disulfide reductase family protein n=1 Tax=Pseudoduganella sp. SL102 TaxID=2995154 RepID=UPI00248BDA73|nr:TlpA disulfide reductase family protein [Pseudoduganella sp. SL102]WBS04887.1 TlpA disulfide reductase family protein [Pseudoduganella sp. SL102]
MSADLGTLALGPQAFSTHVLLVLLAILLATGVAGWFYRRRGVDAGPLVWKMIIAGFVCARVVFVLKHRDIYAAAPWTALDIRDGGFEPALGLVAACVIGAEAVRRSDALRRPLLASVLAGLALWGGGTLALQAMAPAHAPLPDVTVRQLDGTEIALARFAGKPLVVNLWATWCPPCRREMPALHAAQAANPDIAFVFVNQRESADTVRRFLAGQGLRLQNVVTDPAGRLAAATGSAAYPTTLFYDGAGRLVLRHAGELSAATLRDKIERIR